MYNFYQSLVWKKIQTEVYLKDFNSIDIWNKKYFFLKRTKKFLFWDFSWFQLLGADFFNRTDIIKYLTTIKENYSKSFKNIFFQFWINDVFYEFKNGKSTPEIIAEIVTKRTKIQFSMKKLWLKKSFKENMPPANIIYDISKSLDILVGEMSNQAQRYLRKAQNSDFTFWTLDKKEQEVFYKKRQDTAHIKWISVVSYYNFIKLFDFLKKWNWEVFIVKKNGEIICWSIFCWESWYLTYLYWFADRNFRNSWAHNLLNFEVMKRWRQNWFRILDMMWWSPTGILNHSLLWVSSFKESLGWLKQEYYGSFDLVLNPTLYFVFKLFSKILKI